MFTHKPYIYFNTDYVDIFNPTTDDEKLFAEKLKNNNRYFNYYQEVKSVSKVYQAGFFIEPDVIDNDFETYFRKDFFRKNIQEDKHNVVLLICGGFSPLHEGHINIMKKAKDFLEKENYNICGGIISPSHDMYVSKKREGDAHMPIQDRVVYAEKLLHDLGEKWLTVDLWEGALIDGSVNFTKVIDRIKRVLNKDCQQKIEVVFVFGDDNLHFREIFKDNEKAICVRRSNTTEILKPVPHANFNFIIDGDEKNFNISSNNIRLNGFNNPEYKAETNYYEIRNDLKQSLSYIGVPESLFVKTYSSLSDLLNKFVVGNPEILEINIENQKQLFDKLILEKNINFISSDIYIKNKHIADVSRSFDYLSAQVQSNHLVMRGGNSKLEFDIPKGNYLLVDDDIASGFTISKIKKAMPEDVTIIDTLGLNDLVRCSDKKAFDIVDARDFIIGAENGGLFVNTGFDSFRVPYLYPYVNLYFRANIVPSLQREFTLEILKINYNFYNELEKITGDIIKIKHLKESNNWLKFLGYSDEDLLIDIIVSEHNKLAQTFNTAYYV